MSPDLRNAQNLQAKWDTSHERIPKDKDASAYATERETSFPPNAVVADLGGGSGADAMYFMAKGHSVHLVDISNLALGRAQQRAQDLGLSGRLTVHQSELGSQPIPLADSSVDIVYSRLVYHFFSSDQMETNLIEAHRILKNGGIAYITLKSPDDVAEMSSLLERATLVEPGVYNEDGQFKYRFSKEQLAKMLKEKGISGEVEEYRENLGGRNDVVKSGNSEMLLNELVIHKS